MLQIKHQAIWALQLRLMIPDKGHSKLNLVSLLKNNSNSIRHLQLKLNHHTIKDSTFKVSLLVTKVNKLAMVCSNLQCLEAAAMVECREEVKEELVEQEGV